MDTKSNRTEEAMRPRLHARVRAFDPRTLGVVKHGTVVGVGRKYARIDFGLTGIARVAFRDVLEEIHDA